MCFPINTIVFIVSSWVSYVILIIVATVIIYYVMSFVVSFYDNFFFYQKTKQLEEEAAKERINKRNFKQQLYNNKGYLTKLIDAHLAQDRFILKTVDESKSVCKLIRDISVPDAVENTEEGWMTYENLLHFFDIIKTELGEKEKQETEESIQKLRVEQFMKDNNIENFKVLSTSKVEDNDFADL